MSSINENTGLPHYVRFRDLRAAGIVDSWQQLFRLIEDYGFPSGQLLSPNVRAWDRDAVRQWLASRPSERKIVNPPRKQREHEAA
jgi:predicted DNA-binding transcriptional regulator AlpA